MIFRQGDVIIQKSKEISNYATLKQNNKKEPVVLAYGEATGHSHKIKCEHGTVELYEQGNTLFLKVLNEKAFLTHEEHNAIELPKGSYSITIQREYRPGEWVDVED